MEFLVICMLCPPVRWLRTAVRHRLRGDAAAHQAYLAVCGGAVVLAAASACTRTPTRLRRSAVAL